MATVIRPYVLPSAMETKLRQIRRRQLCLSLLRALVIATAVLIVAMLAAMVVDWSATLFQPAARTALTVAALLAAVAALAATAVPPLIATWRWTHAARSADFEVPQLEERWTTVTSIAQTNHQPTTPAARAMLEQVTNEAAAMQQLVQPAKVAPPAALRPAATLLAGCVIVLAAFLAIDWPQTSVLLRRFWSPQIAITATQLDSTTGDVVIPRGQSLELSTRLSGVPRQTATLELATGAEIVDVLELKLDQQRPDSFVHRLSVDQSFRYRISAGDARTPWHAVTAIDYPSLGEVQFTVTAPAYVDRPTYEKTHIPSRIKVVEGSRLELRMKPEQPLERLELALECASAGAGDKPVQRRLTLSPDRDGWYRFETQLLEDMSLAPTLLNAHGLANEDKHLCRIQVVADKAPVARILSPTDEMVVAPDNVIDIKFEAHDDHGIATAELLVYDESKTEEGQEPRLLAVQPIPLEDQQLKQHVLASTQLDLNQLGVKEGASVSYAIRVTDNRQFNLDPDSIGSRIADDRRAKDDDAPNSENTAAGQSSDKTPADMPPAKPAPGESPEREPQGKRDALVDGKSTAPSKDPATSLASDAEKTEAPAKSSDDAADASVQAVTKREPPGEPVSPGDDSPNAAELANRSSTNPETKNDPSGQAVPRPASKEDESRVSNSDSPGDAKRSESPDSTNPAESAPTEAKPPVTGVADAKSGDGEPRKTPSDRQFAMRGQASESGQDSQTNRRKLKVVEGLMAVAAATERETVALEIRQRVERIDELLAAAEPPLEKLAEREIPDAERSEQFQRLDKQLGEVEEEIAELRRETKEHQFAFVGLQMVDIGRTHVGPARERTFIGIREPLAGDNASLALQHVVRARELLLALLKRYDSAARDRKLAHGLDEAVKMYEVYIEKSHQLMREARQNQNPLKRKMAVIEVDQAYLDRYAEVLTLRREMMAELARLLGDDPRLMARYLDLTKRRRTSLRDQLTELAERQDELTLEVNGWLAVDEDQREPLWEVVADLRLQAATPLAKDAAELAEGIEKQLPLVLESDRGTSALVIRHAQQIARLARQITFDAKKFLAQSTDPAATIDLTPSAEELQFLCGELDAALDQLNFQHEDEEEVVSYVASRLPEARAVADQADAWAQTASHLRQKHYPGLAEIDQQKLAIATELLRVQMLGIEVDLQNEFQQLAESDVPEEILALVRELHTVMEGITAHQAAATFALTQNRLEAAALRQESGLQEFERAEKLLDKIRRDVIAALDEYDPRDPNIADLRDPTLDEFLATLEREPNIEAQLGIPDRPRNLRVIAESMEWQQSGGELLGQSGDAAAARARQMMRERQAQVDPQQKPESQWTEEERQQQAKAQQMQESLEKSLTSVEEKAGDPATPPEQRRQLEAMAENMKRMLSQLGSGARDAEEWERIAESDKAKALLVALARGQRLPDEQWNKLLSTLEDGLWQVGGRTPPEDYRKAIEQYQDYLRQLENGDAEG